MISIIIPTYNEAVNIRATIERIRHAEKNGLIKEIIISDGESTDGTALIANRIGARTIISPKKGRAAQMNFGASMASGEILYFLHADTIPPDGFTNDIHAALQKGYGIGSYRLSFDLRHWFLKFNCWFTRFDVNAVRFGDQSLFVKKELFQKAGGFREDLILMEDQEIIHRLKQHGKFIVMKGQVVTSARKYLDNGIFRMQAIFYWIWLLYYLGFSQEYLVGLHRRLIRKK
ncbi:MAG: TIGR04283 family arsenosugar biosynthesis glycosyltransferase [Bacteroidetes bacterium]|nr:TIGR04283 family arsenosugar biosynthesis glycosyltransferase [Bacteroidota bacterium]